MPNNLDPALNADVMHALRFMGHGNTLVVSDTHFPTGSVARRRVIGRPLSIANLSAPAAMRAILSVLPLDTPLQNSAGHMEVMGAPDDIQPVQRKVQADIDRADGKPSPRYGIEHFAFYDLAKEPVV